MNRHFGKLILMIVVICAMATAQQRTQVPLTDRDVIQMVENGKPEAAILASIRSSRTNFDFSPQGCSLLVTAHVNRTILNAMAAPGQPPCTSMIDQQCVAACIQECANTARTTRDMAHCENDCKGRCRVNTASGNNSSSQMLLPASPARTAANGSGGSPGANVAQATSAVSDYRQPPGNKVPSGLKRTVLSGRVLLPPGSRPAGPQRPAASSSLKTTAPVGLVKAQPAGSTTVGPGQAMSAQNPSTSPTSSTNNTNSIARLATNVPHYPGTIEGYVYWDSHWGGGWCGSVSITVSVAQKPNVYTSLGTLGNFAEYVGTVAYNEGDGVVGSVTVCKYTYPNVPIGQDLQVHIDLGPFSLSVSPTNPTVAPINIPKISSIKCGMSSPNAALAQPPLSQKDLNSNWEICGNSAYKVNFMTSPVVWI